MSLSKYEADNEYRQSGYRNGVRCKTRTRGSVQTADRLYRKYNGSSGSTSSNNSSASDLDPFDNGTTVTEGNRTNGQNYSGHTE